MYRVAPNFGALGPLSDTIFTKNHTIGSSMGQLILSDALGCTPETISHLCVLHDKNYLFLIQ
jgi:hypothetical protein